MICTECGATIPSGQACCPECGNELSGIALETDGQTLLDPAEAKTDRTKTRRLIAVIAFLVIIATAITFALINVLEFTKDADTTYFSDIPGIVEEAAE